MKVDKKIKQIISSLLVILFLGYYAGATLFNHTHTYDWGQVTHSHPYLPTAGHSHTAASLQTIDNLTNLDFQAVAQTVVVVLFITTLFCYSTKQQSYTDRYWNHSNLRAPPVSL